MSDSVRPHRWQPTRPRRPWDSPGKNTGVGCHFLCPLLFSKLGPEVAACSSRLCSLCIPQSFAEKTFPTACVWSLEETFRDLGRRGDSQPRRGMTPCSFRVGAPSSVRLHRNSSLVPTCTQTAVCTVGPQLGERHHTHFKNRI